MKKQPEANQLSKIQEDVLRVALFSVEVSDSENKIFALEMKQLLLRAFAIYKLRDNLETERLLQYQHDIKSRLNKCFTLEANNRKIFRPNFPYYLAWLLSEDFGRLNYINSEHNRGINPVCYHAKDSRLDRKPKSVIFSYYMPWISWSRFCLAICTKKPKIVKFKQLLGCISLIPIQIGKERIKVRGVWLNYHDLYHLEVSQLERIQMGKNMVSGIHGINRQVFHEFPIIEEYDSFLDEARIAIHEWLTRPSPFSQIKAICWMILLMLQGINPFAVVSRHLRSLKKKQEELWLFANS